MSSERFDKILKKNLESVRPAYQPHTWDRFSKRLPAVGFLPWFQQYGGWALAGLMMAGWLTTLYTLRSNQELIKDLTASQKKEVARVQPEDRLNNGPAKNSSGGLSAAKKDTVYVVKRTIVEHRHFYSDNRVAATGNSHLPDHLEKLQKTSTAPTTAQPHPVNEAPAEKNSFIPITQDQVVSKNSDTSIAVTENTSALTVIADTGRTEVRSDETIAILDSNRAVQTYNYKFLAALVDSISSKQAYLPPAKPKRPPFRLSSLQPRLGLESLLSLHTYGIGPVVELFPTENLGLSIGIQASTLEAENHKALRDYNSATGKFFLIQYRDYLPHRFDKIEDISIRTTVISLPISLKYYIPLKRDLSLFVQSGTSLDLSAYQEVDFESYLNKNKRRNTFETDAKPNFFHNFMFGAGVQYTRSRIMAQLSPYVVYDFRNIENTPAGSNLGLRASLWVNLFK